MVARHRVSSLVLSTVLAVGGSFAMVSLAGSTDTSGTAAATPGRAAPPTKPRPRVPSVVLRMSEMVPSSTPTTVRVVVSSRRKHARGRVVLRVDGKAVARTRVEHKALQKVSLTLPALTKGTHRVRADYQPRRSRRIYRSRTRTVMAVVGCTAQPGACDFPSPGSTGPAPATKLRNVPGDLTSGPGWHVEDGYIAVDGAGAVLSGIETTYNVDITADGVTIRDSRLVVSGESFGISLRHVSNTLVERVQITAPSADGPQRLMVGIKDIYSDSTGTVIAGCDISRTATGIQIDAGTIRDSYIHDLGFTGDDHVNGTTSNGGTQPLLIEHNTIFNPRDQTDAISLFQDFGPQANRTITNNLIGGGGYTLYAGANPGKETTASNIIVRGNRFSRAIFPRGGFFGYATAYTAGNGNVWDDNVWDDTGTRVPPP